MSRSAASASCRASRWAPAVAAALLFQLAPAPAALAQAGGAQAAGFELTRSVQQSLKRLQEHWVQWTTAFYQDNPQRAGEALRQVGATARQVGFTRLPDLALGAATRAVESAAGGNLARARWALDAAEALDPGRPEISFARARVARMGGQRTAELRAVWQGYRRLWSSPHRDLATTNLRLWGLAVLLAASALFVAFEAAIHGGAVYRDLHRWLARRIRSGPAHVVLILLLIGPLLLPTGPFWLLQIWSVLLWGYLSASERIVTGVVWAIVGLAPLAAAAEQERIALAQLPPLRALAAFGEGRLYGALFADLHVVRSVLPTEPVALELMADVHRTLGQWEVARSLYRELLEAEPGNVTALLNLGAYFYRKGDFALAIDTFSRAAAADPPSAAAYYNLNLGYSESYLFEEARQALDRAREIDAGRVDLWVKTPNPDRVLSFNGSLARGEELRNKLRQAWEGAPAAAGTVPAAVRRYLPLAAAALAALAAVGLHLVRRRWGYGEPVPWLPWHTGLVGRWLRALVPPLSQLELGEGFAAFGTLLGLTALCLLPAVSWLGVDLAVGWTPGPTLLSVASLGGLLLYTGFRIWTQIAREQG